MRQDLGEADQRQLLHREQADQAALGHARAADPEELETVAGLLVERLDQAAAEHVAGRLAGEHEDLGRAASIAAPLSRGRRRRSRTGRRDRRPRPRRARSMIRQLPACTATPASRAAAAAATVPGPIVGRSARRSCFGFFSLTSTPPGPSRRRPAQRASSWSVPSTASTPSTRPCCTTTAWPTSSSPRRAATSMPCAMSRAAAASGRDARSAGPRAPAASPITLVGADHAEPLAPRARRRSSGTTGRRRGRAKPELCQQLHAAPVELHGVERGRRTGPIITTSSAAGRVQRAERSGRPRRAAPTGAARRRPAAGSVSPSKASTKTSRPARPRGADHLAGQRPAAGSTASLRRHRSADPVLARHADRAVAGAADEVDDLHHPAVIGELARRPRPAARRTRLPARTAAGRPCAGPGSPRATTPRRFMPTMLRPFR